MTVARFTVFRLDFPGKKVGRLSNVKACLGGGEGKTSGRRDVSALISTARALLPTGSLTYLTSNLLAPTCRKARQFWDAAAGGRLYPLEPVELLPGPELATELLAHLRRVKGSRTANTFQSTLSRNTMSTVFLTSPEEFPGQLQEAKEAPRPHESNHLTPHRLSARKRRVFSAPRRPANRSTRQRIGPTHHRSKKALLVSAACKRERRNRCLCARNPTRPRCQSSREEKRGCRGVCAKIAGVVGIWTDTTRTFRNTRCGHLKTPGG
ncbi:uncharacterized protein J3D65DRAFT_62618 [Phyllosticta citribraziliensis]|uniref:Uncharacterized protein n=1 Tax=Phyllosticta citribraziliensis TaxID=989973 RepID=A0ABR1LCK9_9PEZI